MYPFDSKRVICVLAATARESGTKYIVAVTSSLKAVWFSSKFELLCQVGHPRGVCSPDKLSLSPSLRSSEKKKMAQQHGHDI
jgi:hypothetical protein